MKKCSYYARYRPYVLRAFLMPTLPRVVAAATAAPSGVSPSPLMGTSRRSRPAAVEQAPPLLPVRFPPRKPRAPKLRPRCTLSSPCEATARPREDLPAAAFVALLLLKLEAAASEACMASLSSSQLLSAASLLPLAAERMPPLPHPCTLISVFLNWGMSTPGGAGFDAEAVDDEADGTEPPPPTLDTGRLSPRCYKAKQNTA